METKNLDWGKRTADGKRQYTLKTCGRTKENKRKHSTVKTKGSTKWVRGEHHSTDPRTAENAQNKIDNKPRTGKKQMKKQHKNKGTDDRTKGNGNKAKT